MANTSKSKITLEELRLWAFFHQTNDIITECEEHILRETGVTAQQLVVLWMMKFFKQISNKPVKITELAQSLYRSLNGISLIIDRMEKKGIIKKARHLQDRRAIDLIITPEGEEKYIAAIIPNLKVIKKLLSVYSQEEIETLTELLKKLNKKAMDEYHKEDLSAGPTLTDTKALKKLLRDNIFQTGLKRDSQTKSRTK